MSDSRSGSELPHDRRRHFRAKLDAGAIIHAAQVALRGTIIDLSLGGVRIRRADELAPCPALGTEALVELELGGRGWVAQPGHLLRGGIGEVVVEFGPLAAGLEDRIEDEVLAAIEAARRPRLLVVDPSADGRRRIVAALAAAGCDSMEAATPLEALDAVDRCRGHLRGVAIATRLTQTGGDELCDFLAQAYPNLCIALIGVEPDDPALDRAAPCNRVSRFEHGADLDHGMRAFSTALRAARVR